MKFQKFEYKKINSTNDIAIKKIKFGYLSGIVVSIQQKKARGQYGKKWISYKGNLFMTIFFNVKKSISLSKLTKLNCNIIKQSISKILKKKIKIKYPNDLLINNKKFCGILQETIINEKKKFMIVGIGINLVKSPNIKNYLTTNILKETGLILNRKKLLEIIEKNYLKKLNLFA
ncbi:MAG: biotin--[acetyl-CoA-carboxylase] ligase [Pelagibacteraceae bacterium]|nr:biotin--[acetyl-CoA-carboxylase] ligase [Pelagibacteraceae bacterium]|tara:strand:+ start:2071 stop:2592 length:522 start_codon:yes stop_codon:yes gene_type:complete